MSTPFMADEEAGKYKHTSRITSAPATTAITAARVTRAILAPRHFLHFAKNPVLFCGLSEEIVVVE
jgi:hypothetical protein